MSLRKLAFAGALVLAALGGPAVAAETSDAAYFTYTAGPSGQFGEPGPGTGQLAEPAGLAVEESTGDVYVADQGNGRVEVFDAQGAYLSQFDGSEAPGGKFVKPVDVAVDNSGGPGKGRVYVLDQGSESIEVFTAAGKYVTQLTGVCENPGEAPPCTGSRLLPFGRPVGVAVDTAGDLWVYAAGSREGLGVVSELDAAGDSVGQFQTNRETAPGFAVDASGDAYASMINGNVLKFDATHADVGEVDISKAAKALAADFSTGNLFVDRGGAIAKYGSFGEPPRSPVETFGTEGLAESDGITVDAATGTIYASERQAGKVDLFEGTPIASPKVEDQTSVTSVTRTSALVSGTVDPGGADTSYAVEAVSDAEYLPQAADPYREGSRSASFAAGEGTVDVPVGPLPLTGLLAGTTYHYRLLASSQAGTVYGADHTFVTAPATPPLVSTGAALEATATGVVLAGTVDPRELQTSYEFEVGTDTSYAGAKLFGNVGSNGVEEVSAGLQFLIPGTTYHYRLVASNEDGTSYGQDLTFTTPGTPTPIAQPPAAALIASPVVQFPSVAGAITKPQASVKRSKQKRRAKQRTARKRRAHRHSGGKAQRSAGGAKGQR